MAKAKGDGVIIEKGRNHFEVQVYIGRDPITGTKKRISKTIHGTKADARKLRDQLKRELEGGLKADASNLTFAQWCAEWLNIRRSKKEVSESVLRQNEKRLNFMSSLLRDVKLNKIDARTIEQLLISIRETREKQGYSCTDSTLRHYFVLVKQCLRTAVDYDLIMRNPCDRIKPPKKNETNRKSLTASEGETLLTAINEYEENVVNSLLAKEQRQSDRNNSYDRSYLLGMRDISLILMVRLGLASGFRLGECMALTWGCVDFESSHISIVQAMDNLGQIKTPKSAAGVRCIAIDKETMTHLAAWQSLQGALLETIEINVDDSSPVFCSSEGDFLTKSSFRHWWYAWRKKYGFPDLKFHELRHTQATQLLANGLSVADVQERLGHSDASLTLNCYAHALAESDEKAAVIIGNLFSNKDAKSLTKIA